LPKGVLIPDLTQFAKNNMGVAALEGEELIGYLGAYYPIEDAFGTTNVKGIFSPIHAHGVINKRKHSKVNYNRDRIYSLLYQAAAQKWVNAGVRSHAIALYAHDKEGINSFFYNGFGLRCIDSIRSLDKLMEEKNIILIDKASVEYCEIPREKWGELLDLHNALILHLGSCPAYLKIPGIDVQHIYERSGEDVRYFGAKINNRYVAYFKISSSGENFITEHELMMNICGAYCEPSYRGSGINHNLLLFMMRILKKENYHYLGVDCESFNPNARGFWLKYFKEYTHSVVRRIDEKAIDLIVQ